MFVIFDLDGVLVELRGMHFAVLNEAIAEHGGAPVTHAEHLRHLDGLPTRQKLDWLVGHGHVRDSVRGMVWEDKQRRTAAALRALRPDPRLRAELTRIREAGHELACVSNSTEGTVVTALAALGLDDLFGFVSGTAGIKHPKPHPESYLRAMAITGHEPAETVIVEDSPAGREAARRAGALVVPVESPADVTAQLVLDAIGRRLPQPPPRWATDWTIIVPIAGAGTRFADHGYLLPKPMIGVGGRPMIAAVVDNLGIDGRWVFVCQREHVERHHLDVLLSALIPGMTLVIVPELTKGAACSVAAALRVADPDRPALVVNGDQLVDWDPARFAWSAQGRDGLIATHTATDRKWSYAVLDGERVTRVVEKEPVGDVATVGIYWWRTGRLLSDSIEEMIAAEDRTMGEFYLAPAYNYAIAHGADVGVYPVDAMHGLGTPEDLAAYLEGRT